jgi:hypothetical protein
MAAGGGDIGRGILLLGRVAGVGWVMARAALFGAGFVAGCAVEMVRCGK